MLLVNWEYRESRRDLYREGRKNKIVFTPFVYGSLVGSGVASSRYGLRGSGSVGSQP